MKIDIETAGESVACAEALRKWIVAGLTLSGYLEWHRNEQPYYTRRRELADKLAEFIKTNR